MKIPSKKALQVQSLKAAQRGIQDDLDALLLSDEAAARTKFDELLALRRELAQLEAQPDEYTCPQCGNDFGDSAHADLLVAAVVIYDNAGKAIPRDRRDFGITDARRVKFCGSCSSSWAIPVLEYLEMR
jgi:hypothetical protein